MKVRLSALAAFKAQKLIDFLETKWSLKTKERFIQKLTEKLKVLESKPEGFPISDVHTDLRKLVVTKHTTILYKIMDDSIFIVTLIDNRQNPLSIEKEIKKYFG